MIHARSINNRNLSVGIRAQNVRHAGSLTPPSFPLSRGDGHAVMTKQVSFHEARALVAIRV